MDQSPFRAALFERDQRCLVTRIPPTLIVACHIIPVSRQDIWSEFGEDHPYGPACGLTLSRDLHAMWDQYMLGLYPLGISLDGRFVVHFFQPVNAHFRSFHGLVLERSRFRTTNDDDLPYAKYLLWHYSQCVMTHLRGIPVAEPRPVHPVDRFDALPPSVAASL
ncbi:BQ5605_C010g05932 [Microbotryum silenes-dioicae]|uniref:BQ5605_C010g05932 protein n=1 Tax=Microbotryum silenes-dioicae TaxID=796604 RepID=A0A2X0MB73_9BASI|nr:BQ5605_C010g05932 [Microbotryum silenes-dioicae]